MFQFKSILDLIRAFPDEQACIKHLENLRWGNEDGSVSVASPFDPSSTVYKCAGSKYKCRNTGKYFNVKHGTIFEDTKIPLQKWFLSLYVFSSHKKGLSSHQLARDIDVTQKTAWFLLHRLRYAFQHPGFRAMLGMTSPVEADETYVGGKEANKHKDKRTKGTQGRSTLTKQPVMGLVERGGIIIAKVVAAVDKETLESILIEHVVKGATLSTDEYTAYNDCHLRWNHIFVEHGKGSYVDGLAHTNTLEGFWGLLKRGLKGIYHQVSRRLLQRYVDEFTYRYNTRRMQAEERFNLVLANINHRVTYKSLTA